MAKAQKKVVKNTYTATVADYQSTFNTDSGRRVLRHLMKVHGFMVTSHVEGDAYSTAFNEGGRNAIIQIIKKTKMDLAGLEAAINQNEEEFNAYQ